MRRRIRLLAASAGLVLSLGVAIPASATVPTELAVTPVFQDLFCAGSVDRAYWTVNLDGGTTGQYKVTVTYGDGSAVSTSYHSATYDTHHDYSCGPNHYFYSNWSAYRGGGGTAYNTGIQVAAYK